MMQKMVLQGGLVAGVGASLFVMRKVLTPQMHEAVAARERLVKEQPALASSLSEVAMVATPEQMRRILDEVDDILRHDAEGKPSSQWHISRINASVLGAVRRVCVAVDHTAEEGRFRSSLSCESDTLPQLQSQLDDLLHNHLLARG